MEAVDIAKKIVKTLSQSGYTAYFAGGWVRDLLLGHPSDDVDIATDAPPEKIVELFPKTVQVGIAFGVVVVVMDGHQFEVATFRRDIASDGRRPEKIEPSTPKEDALRRDFTINGMFYDPLTETLHDFVGGEEDLKKGLIRTIGDPNERFREDRLRMIRAVRFSTRLRFPLDSKTDAAIWAHAKTLFPHVSIERVMDEFRKMAKTETLGNALVELHRLGLLAVIFPKLEDVLLEEIKKRVISFTHFPKNSPTILFLLELFPNLSEDEAVEICRYLKTSNRDIQLAERLFHGRKLIQQQREGGNQAPSRAEWCRFYAEPNALRCLEICVAKLAERERKDFLESDKKRQKILKTHIERIQQKKPLIRAKDLEEGGIEPGKAMGLLLEEAVRLSIEEDLHDKQALLLLLKKSPIWPT